jgi:hypothetical protein
VRFFAGPIRSIKSCPRRAHGGRAATGGAFSPKRASRFYRNVEVGPRPSHGLHYVKPISCTVTRRLFEAPDGVDALALDCVRVVQEVFWVAVAGKKICAIKRRHGCDFENYVRSGYFSAFCED